MSPNIPDLTSGRISIRGIRPRDAKPLERELMLNRSWLRKWEATTPQSFISFDTKGSIRSLLNAARFGGALPFAIELDGEFVGQLNVSGIVMGSLSSAQLGYWVSERAAGNGATPTAVALATDYCFRRMNLHRMEICIRPENAASLRVVEKLGFRYEGLRRRYIHINGDWRDHFSFALTREDVPGGVLDRWLSGSVPAGATHIPEGDIAAAASGTDSP
ncbi:GNAT family protein [Alpinimonas psychrophila]|uniref:Ribosomal-protein-alanine N-acetyltransferase n=1 Tax=Alpinimonas psychrophila TaxID=748908 RepID=A0A7W3JRR0_9MICO|nr:GNAT family protein [Alpinimonas psychrophila]MBA8828013.1 ribosomal-protein-alanine N-acetyltransferase [Alpinimonas psychrophila]